MSKEAMKLALDALQEVYWSSRSAKHDEAITALREALAEQPAQTAGKSELETVPAKGGLLAEQPAPVQESVAELVVSQYSHGTRLDIQWSPDSRAMLLDIGRYPLYTTPQAQRKPLTDEQLRSMCNQTWVFETIKQWVRVIEAAHGIKENT